MGFFSKLFGKKNNEVKEPVAEVKAAPVKAEEVIEAAPVKTDQKNTEEVKTTPVKKTREASKKASQPPKKAAPQQKAEKSAKEDTKKSAEKEVSAPKAEEPEKTAGKTGFFRIKKSKDDRYVFNLYASNKVIVATSQVYSSANSAINGINSVKNNAALAPIEDQTLKNYTTLPYPKWEIYQDKGGDYRFRLSASNGSCVCHSQGYTSKANCKNGIQSIIRTVKDAEIEKAYLTK